MCMGAAYTYVCELQPGVEADVLVCSTDVYK